MMKKFLFLLIFILLLPTLSFAQEKKNVIYFYADWCSHCRNVDAFFKENGVYEIYNVEKLDFDKAENKSKLAKFFEEKKYGGTVGIPAVIIDGRLISGDVPIIGYFQKELEKIPKIEKEKIQENEEPKNKTGIPIWALVGAALVDASNPCALAVLILLLATVIAAKGKKQALLAGLMFSLAIFLSYFLMGIGVYHAIGVLNISKYLSIGSGILAIAVGLANLKDAFWYGKFFIMEVPMKWRPAMQAMLKKVTSPFGAFGAGFVVSLFLVPCASGPYVAILGMIADRVSVKPLSLLLLYNLIFVLPMLIITGAMYFGTRMGKLEKWRQENLRLLHAVAGTIMLLLGIYIIYSRV